MRGSIAAIGLALLAACGSGGSGDAAGNGQAAPGEKAAATAPTGETLAMQPGQWEMRTEVVAMNMPNMPAGMRPPATPPTTVTYCLTPEQASRPDANFLTGSQSGNCRAENMSMAGGRISGTVTCDNQGAAARVEMTGQFTPTSYELNQTIHSSAQGVNVDLESRTIARRIGDCPG